MGQRIVLGFLGLPRPGRGLQAADFSQPGTLRRQLESELSSAEGDRFESLDYYYMGGMGLVWLQFGVFSKGLGLIHILLHSEIPSLSLSSLETKLVCIFIMMSSRLRSPERYSAVIFSAVCRLTRSR